MKRRRWAFENAVRRHNHLGLAVGLLEALVRVSVRNGADRDLWKKTIENAKGKMRERVERRRELAKEGKMEVDE